MTTRIRLKTQLKSARGVGGCIRLRARYTGLKNVIAADFEPVWRTVFITILLLVAVDAFLFDWKYFDLFTRMVGEIARGFGFR